MNKTIYTAIIGSRYDDLMEPTVMTPGWDYICFSDQPLISRRWKVVQIDAGNDPQRKAREIKIMFHKFIDAEQSIWIDASFQINVNLDLIWNYFKAPFTAPRHPIRRCVYAEGRSCIINGRGDARQIQAQMDSYKLAGLQIMGDNIISSGVLLRDLSAIPLCEAWWKEVCIWSVRDQMAFAKVCGDFEWNKFNWDYSQSKELQYYKHLKYR